MGKSESVQEYLVVGARVRYVPLAGPCNYTPALGSYAASKGATDGHASFVDAENKVGTIIYTDDEFPGHPYEVRMDNTYTFDGQEWRRITAAAHELALVEE